MTELFTVTDLKQYFVCNRIVYYHTCLPDIRPITAKMEVGLRRHEKEPPQSKRRHYQIPDIIERNYNVSLKSDTLGLSGQVDELIETPTGYIPVDYKLSRKASQHFKLQVTAYAMLIEEIYHEPVLFGVLYLIQSKRHQVVEITQANRRKITKSLQKMHTIADTQVCPPPTKSRNLCRECEFRRFCNDVS